MGLRAFIAGQYTTRWGVFTAASVVGTIPIAVIFYILKDPFVSGLTQGAVKE
ncbi:hypothetical protein [Limnochorda pilosa]|uniref:Sugar ABC transporter permease n=1 Tax=Limnochorda pilosa TaxID=1555112 RepID=A0A0K2SH90_LIMPI|nr:hypothetical protein [Limnochorda pilosa]BAS26460.1 sugar ABC transporter permease [Limnochorda pilosa]